MFPRIFNPARLRTSFRYFSTAEGVQVPKILHLSWTGGQYDHGIEDTSQFESFVSGLGGRLFKGPIIDSHLSKSERFFVSLQTGLNTQQIVEQAQQNKIDAISCDAHQIPKEAGVRVVSRQGAGVDPIEAPTVMNMAGINAPAVVQAMTADISWRYPAVDVGRAHHEIRNGEATTHKIAQYTWNGLYDVQAGILGFGNMGKRITQVLTAQGANVTVYSPSTTEEKAQHYGAKVAKDPLDLAVGKDLLIVLIPLLQQTRGIVGHDMIERLNKEANVLVYGRAETADASALKTLLERGGGVSCDADLFRDGGKYIGPMAPYVQFLDQYPDKVRLTPHVTADCNQGVRGLMTQISYLCHILPFFEQQTVTNKAKGETPEGFSERVLSDRQLIDEAQKLAPR